MVVEILVFLEDLYPVRISRVSVDSFFVKFFQFAIVYVGACKGFQQVLLRLSSRTRGSV